MNCLAFYDYGQADVLRWGAGEMVMSRYRLSVFAILAVSSIQAQQKPPDGKVVELPLPLVSPRVLQPGTMEPLSPREKVARALRNTFGPKSIANRLLIAGINQWQDSPEEWPQGMEGYGMRFGSRMGRLAVRNAVQLGADLAFRTDSRYDRCDCVGFLSRTSHAWKRVFVTRKDAGGETIAISNFAGAYIPPMVTYQWYPDSHNTWRNKMQAGTEFLGWRGIGNMVREFWPEISRTARLTRFKYE